jgi:hypothetical protein
MQEQLIELFYEYLPAWSWEEWQAAGSSDREEIVINAIADIGPDIDIEEAYDIFYDWAAGLTEADFNPGLKEATDLEETVKITSDPDKLWHSTELGPFYKIFTSGTMLSKVRGDEGVQALCFTTDKDYIIYDYPCTIELSRSKLLDAGYELYPVDEFEDDEYGRGESEERINKDITNIWDYVTAVEIRWADVAAAEDEDDLRLSTAEYDDQGNESDNWDLKLSDLREVLDDLTARGIKVTEVGEPMPNDEYWFDETGEFRYGRDEIAV